jgi:hypothetical protein
MQTLLVVAALVCVAAALGVAIRRRLSIAAPTQPRMATVPSQLDRADFAEASKPWLVVLFSSQTCDSCGRVRQMLPALASDSVTVQDVDQEASNGLHKRYAIDTVPLTVVADAAGIVKCWFLGVPSATDLWAAVAEVREPGSTPEPHLGH